MQLCARFGMGGAGPGVATDDHQLSSELRSRLDGGVRAILDEECERAAATSAAELDALERVTGAMLAQGTVDRDRFLGLLEP